MGDVVNLNDYKARRTFAALFPFLVAVVLLVVFFGSRR